MDHDTSATLKQGVGRFETLLDCFDMGGSIDEALRKTLLEMSSVRNVLVHRRGSVDKRFVSNCPWMNYKPGDKVNVTPDMYGLYNKATEDYFVVVINRFSRRFNMSLTRNSDGKWLFSRLDESTENKEQCESSGNLSPVPAQ